MKRSALMAVVFAAILIFGADATRACSCAGTPTVCSAYAGADAVFVGTVTKTIGRQFYLGDQNRSYVQVQKVYKGSVPKEVIFDWGTTSCDVAMQAGENWLLYASKIDGSQTRWYIGQCGRSRQLKSGDEDLNYLESSNKGKQVSRLSGSLTYTSGFPLQSIEVEIDGAGEKRKLRTDEFGFFEIYGLDPGSYTVGPSIKDDWSGFAVLDGNHIRPGGPHKFDPATDRLTVDMGKDACLETSFRLETYNYIKGVVASEEGVPVTDVCVKARRVDQPASIGFEVENCVNEDGVFLFSGVPAGKYLLWAESQTLNRPWASNRFPPVYFPNSLYRATAQPVTVTDEVSPEIRINIPKNHPGKLLSGSVKYSDGSPASDEQVVFTFRDGPENRAIGARSDTKGTFRIPITGGIRGRLSAHGTIWSHEIEECDKLRKYGSKEKEEFSLVSIESNSIPINVNRKRSNLILRLPYSKCPEPK